MRSRDRQGWLPGCRHPPKAVILSAAKDLLFAGHHGKAKAFSSLRMTALGSEAGGE
jgi:hypothetical protein